MASHHKADIDKLGKKISALNDALGSLGQSDDLQELLRRIHGPGWTTPAELSFAMGIVDSMTAQAASLGNLKATLLKGSSQVGI